MFDEEPQGSLVPVTAPATSAPIVPTEPADIEPDVDYTGYSDADLDKANADNIANFHGMRNQAASFMRHKLLPGIMEVINRIRYNKRTNPAYRDGMTIDEYVATLGLTREQIRQWNSREKKAALKLLKDAGVEQGTGTEKYPLLSTGEIVQYEGRSCPVVLDTATTSDPDRDLEIADKTEDGTAEVNRVVKRSQVTLLSQAQPAEPTKTQRQMRLDAKAADNAHYADLYFSFIGLILNPPEGATAETILLTLQRVSEDAYHDLDEAQAKRIHIPKLVKPDPYAKIISLEKKLEDQKTSFEKKINDLKQRKTKVVTVIKSDTDLLKKQAEGLLGKPAPPQVTEVAEGETITPPATVKQRSHPLAKKFTVRKGVVFEVGAPGKGAVAGPFEGDDANYTTAWSEADKLNAAA